MFYFYSLWCLILWAFFSFIIISAQNVNKTDMKLKVLDMFYHAYWSYMENAFPADELMPLSCKPRYRGISPARGDIDDAMGNYSLTLIDALDTLAIIGDFEEFERAVTLVIDYVQFDSDVYVSVFESNIRVLSGLISAHLMALVIQTKADEKYLQWYDRQLLDMAEDLAQRLLPAFNTTSGLPYPRINLRYGITSSIISDYHDTCTACGGTMILEFAALSRLTGNPVYEDRAKKALNFLWEQRHRTSDLMGTVLNIHNGDWIRKDSGVGAGIDSYYEYLLKAYILLGDESYLHRFNKHYDAIERYVRQGPLLVEVHMHKPETQSRSYMDSLLAFWPGLQVLKGDLKPAIEIHQMLYEVVQKHKFLPEAFTYDFQVHWAQHPLRPEFVESTYLLYAATHDPHYLEVGVQVVNSLNEHGRVPCGFAAVKDVRTFALEDQMDSFVLAETFKYLYLLFAEPSDLPVDISAYIFTTEAHLLPLSLASQRTVVTVPPLHMFEPFGSGASPIYQRQVFQTCPDLMSERFYENQRTGSNDVVGTLQSFGQYIRKRVTEWVGSIFKDKTPEQILKRVKVTSKPSHDVPRLRALHFNAADPQHVLALKRMGIEIQSASDGLIQLIHYPDKAESVSDAGEGVVFMQEMIELSKNPPALVHHPTRVIQIVSNPFHGSQTLIAFPALFGVDFDKDYGYEIVGEIAEGHPLQACSELMNRQQTFNRIVIVERNGCMFVEKARNAQLAGAIGVIVVDHVPNTTSEANLTFAMSGDGSTDVTIPVVFLFRKEGDQLREWLKQRDGLLHVRIAVKSKNPATILIEDIFKSRRIICRKKRKFKETPKVNRSSNKAKIIAQNQQCHGRVGVQDTLENVLGRWHKGDFQQKENIFSKVLQNVVDIVHSNVNSPYLKSTTDDFSTPTERLQKILRMSDDEKETVVDKLLEGAFDGSNLIAQLPSSKNNYVRVLKKSLLVSFGVNLQLSDEDSSLLKELIGKLAIQKLPLDIQMRPATRDEEETKLRTVLDGTNRNTHHSSTPMIRLNILADSLFDQPNLGVCPKRTFQEVIGVA